MDKLHIFFKNIENWLSLNKTFIYIFLIIISLIGLYLTSLFNYLLFHSLAELFSIVIAYCLFLVAWNARQYIKNTYLLFIGIAYFFVAGIDLLHTLAYKGMPIFTDYDYYANQLWIAARYLESITLAGAFYFLMRKKIIWPYLTFISYAIISCYIVLSVFYWKKFPVCFIDGQGLTQFKVVSEYIICFILLLSSGLLYINRKRFEKNIFNFLTVSIICTIISELAFTFYINNYGVSNLVGHFFKIFSYFFVYKAIIQTGVQSPYDIIFRDLEKLNQNLTTEIEVRRETERELKAALDDIKMLSGIIPICSYCKQIRNDSGYWQQVEKFIHLSSGAEFSHGICPTCYEKELKAIDKD